MKYKRKFDVDIKNSIIYKTDSDFFRRLFKAETEGKEVKEVLTELNYDHKKFTTEEKEEIKYYIENKSGHNITIRSHRKILKNSFF